MAHRRRSLRHAGAGRSDDEWIRYEHAVSDVLGDVPLHAPCAYDLDLASSHVLRHALAAHAALHGERSSHPRPLVVVSSDAKRLRTRSKRWVSSCFTGGTSMPRPPPTVMSSASAQ